MRRMLMFLHAWHNQHFFLLLNHKELKVLILLLFIFQGSIPLSWKGTRLRRRFSHFWWIWRSGTCRPSSSGHCTCQYPGSDVFCLSLFCQGYRFTWFFFLFEKNLLSIFGDDDDKFYSPFTHNLLLVSYDFSILHPPTTIRFLPYELLHLLENHPPLRLSIGHFLWSKSILGLFFLSAFPA